MVANELESFEKKALEYKLRKSTYKGLEIMRYNGRNTGFYIPNIYTKKKIILHHTVGNLYGDLLTLTSPKRVSVAFVIGRGGQILQLFDPKYWSYHLGPGALGGNTKQSMQSIGIELSNFGWLTRQGNIMYDAYGRPFCMVSENDKYVMTPPYRGHNYWHRYTEEQYTALRELLVVLTKQFNIPYKFLPLEKRMQFTLDVIPFNGICTHVNFRQTGKWDVSPAFDWSKIQNDGT